MYRRCVNFLSKNAGMSTFSCLKTPVLGPETRGGRVTPGPDGPTAGWPGGDFPATITEGYPMPRVARLITSNFLKLVIPTAYLVGSMLVGGR